MSDITDSLEEEWEDLGEEDKRKRPKMDHDVIMEVAHNLTGNSSPSSFFLQLSLSLSLSLLCVLLTFIPLACLTDSPSDFSADIACVESELANLSSLLRDFESAKTFVQLNEHGDYPQLHPNPYTAPSHKF